jgi:phage N-6-adenine-methyltransferase
MLDVTVVDNNELPALIQAAANRLAMAKTSGEVLEARDMANLAYHASKSAARIALKKKAHDEVIAMAYRMQGDALSIESRAKIRLADEYDAAQERGEVATNGQRGPEKAVEYDNSFSPSTAADLGLRRDEIHEARQLRDAEIAQPGVIDAAIAERLSTGDTPTRASINAVVQAVNKPHVSQNSGNNEWYTPPEFIEAARMVLGEFTLDPASSEIANQTVKALQIFTADDDGLSQEWPIGTIWMNPPYAQPLMGQFAEKFASEVKRGSSGIVLVNNATETAWFQTLASECSAVCFPKSRIKFLDIDGNLKGTPLQGQAILYFGLDANAFFNNFSCFGSVFYHEI